MKPLKPLFIILLAFSLVLPISSVFGSSVMWSQFYGTAETGMPYALVETSNGGYAIAGGQQALGVSSGFWLVKTDEFGVVPEFPPWTILIAGLSFVAVLSMFFRHKFKQEREK